MSELPELQLGPLADLQRRVKQLEEDRKDLIESVENLTKQLEVLIEMKSDGQTSS